MSALRSASEVERKFPMREGKKKRNGREKQTQRGGAGGEVKKSSEASHVSLVCLERWDETKKS